MRLFSNLLILSSLSGIAVPAFPQTPPGMLPYTAILEPQFVSTSEATFLLGDDILIGVARGSIAKAYPIADLVQHGSVNDQMPDSPIEVTFCGTCNTGAVFRAQYKGRLLHFDYDSMVGANEVHKDRETGSRWQQSTGEAISGALKGRHLELYPFARTTWKEWRKRYPDTVVLKPLPGYAEIMPKLSTRMKQVTRSNDEPAPKAAFGHDDRLRPKEVVAGLTIGKESKAFPFSQLRIARVVNDIVGGAPVLVVHQPSSDTTTAFEARAKGKVVRFQAVDADASSLVDLETHSSWNAYGRCLQGPLKGAQLKTLILVGEYWFAWSEFHPQTKIFTAAPSPLSSKILMQEPLDDAADPKVSVFTLPIRPGLIAGPHTHKGPVFAYILEGNIENQVEPEPAKIYHAGDFFYEPMMHVHRLLRNLSDTEPAKLLIFQVGDTGKASPAVKLLMQEPLMDIANREAHVIKVAMAPGAALPGAHKHPGPVFAYILKGEIENQVDPDPPKIYREGDLFYEPPMHAHRLLRNRSKTEPAELLIFQVGEKGKPLAMNANE